MTVCLDADCTIYFVEQNPVWGPRIMARIAALRAAGDEIAVSDLARTECLAKPLATGDLAVVADYQGSSRIRISASCRSRPLFANVRRAFERRLLSS